MVLMQGSILPRGVVILVLLVVLFAPPIPTFAATITVTTTDDELTSNGRCSLREAILNANANQQVSIDCPSGGPDDTILLGDGTYRLKLAGAAEETALTGDLDLIGVTTIIGNGASTTVIDGGHLDRVFEVRQGDIGVLRDLTIQGGSGPPVTGVPSGGGGIRNLGTMTLTNVVVTENLGSGIENAGTMTISASSITENQSAYGGGLRNSGTLTLLDVEIVNNIALVGIATGTAGGIYNDGTIVMHRGSIRNNVAQHGTGGGIDQFGGSIELTNVNVSENAAFFGGGGLEVDSGTVSLTNVTIWHNTVSLPAPGDAQNIRLSGSATVRARNTIVANPSGILNCSRVLVSEGNNLESGAHCGFIAAHDLRNTDPRLGPLVDNGGLTRTQALLPGSPAIDAGTNNGCPSTDQRGYLRPADGDLDGRAVCDIGAFEAGAVAPPLMSTPRREASVPEVRSDSENAPNKKRKLTSEQQQHRERTNRAGPDDHHTEGNVVGVCVVAESAPCLYIANRDGLVKVILIGEAAKSADSIKLDNYFEAEGEKENEQLFYAETVRVNSR